MNEKAIKTKETKTKEEILEEIKKEREEVLKESVRIGIANMVCMR